MKRMIQMLVCCVLATVLVMGSMANAMAQSMVVGQFDLEPQQEKILKLLSPQKPFSADFFSAISGTTVVVYGGDCKKLVTIEVPANKSTSKQFNCGYAPYVSFTNKGNSPVLVNPKQ